MSKIEVSLLNIAIYFLHLDTYANLKTFVEKMRVDTHAIVLIIFVF